MPPRRELPGHSPDPFPVMGDSGSSTWFASRSSRRSLLGQRGASSGSATGVERRAGVAAIPHGGSISALIRCVQRDLRPLRHLSADDIGMTETR